MNQIRLLTLTFIAATIFAACTGSAANKPAANVANATVAAKSVDAAPSKDTLMIPENKAWYSWKAKNGKYFEEYLADNAIGMGSSGRSDKTEIIKRISDPTCEVNDFSLTEEQMTPLAADVALLTYKATQDAKCGGKALPATVRAATVLVRSGEKWKAAYHNEVAVIDPKAASAKPVNKTDAPKKDDAKAPPSDEGTDAMLTVEKAVWEAWKDHDGKRIDELTAKDISFINIFGTFLPNKVDAIKDWTSTGCQVKSVSVSDAVGTMVSPTVGILTFKGGADGTCFGQKVPPIWGTSIYVKDGDAWKWAFGMNISAD